MALGQRRALVIGNDEYHTQSRLRNAVNDAHGVTQALRALNFHVKYETDLNGGVLENNAGQFVSNVHQGDTVFFYFSGHGLQYENRNYLVGVNAGQLTSANFRPYCLGATRLLENLVAKHPRTIIFILDCCRNNPFVRYNDAMNGHDRSSGFKHGLAKMEFDAPTHKSVNQRRPAIRIIIGFACASGATSRDRSLHDGRGMYGYHLVAQLTRRTNITKILKQVRTAVIRDSQSTQIPYVHDNGHEPEHLSDASDGFESN
ncbi:unnamed protein product [Rotaria sordida]|uniref:Caspase family p20 domain-containing protein n=1 Tax=Rotaria sordida TaxID=392033 RepID=A0A819RZQ2_9BILA|nr:unnamed protein product [Rotaria sordida]CAF1242796.1 unnamed protein product [Rotaria sordida]CAF1509249.1 unnamed protein product [Rotaria sordida]CAF1524666.1 unnamed protein product [Rotaria sordida]CAF4025084.1 unnamed protein product [Rotaria sordida]